jgi:hypothetical protein
MRVWHASETIGAGDPRLRKKLGSEETLMIVQAADEVYAG